MHKQMHKHMHVHTHMHTSKHTHKHTMGWSAGRQAGGVCRCTMQMRMNIKHAHTHKHTHMQVPRFWTRIYMKFWFLNVVRGCDRFEYGTCCSAGEAYNQKQFGVGDSGVLHMYFGMEGRMWDLCWDVWVSCGRGLNYPSERPACRLHPEGQFGLRPHETSKSPTNACPAPIGTTRPLGDPPFQMEK